MNTAPSNNRKGQDAGSAFWSYLLGFLFAVSGAAGGGAIGSQVDPQVGQDQSTVESVEFIGGLITAFDIVGSVAIGAAGGAIICAGAIIGAFVGFRVGGALDRSVRKSLSKRR